MHIYICIFNKMSLSIMQSFIIFIFIYTAIANESSPPETTIATTVIPKITIIYRDSLNTKYDFPFVEIPFFASVFYNPGNYSTFTYNFICSASLISFQWALTAASCKKSTIHNTETYVITAGFLANPYITVDNSAVEFVRGQRRLISDWIVHPNFTTARFHKNDIALLKIDKPFKLNSYVNLIGLLPFSRNSFCDVSPLYTACSTPVYKNKTLTEDSNLLLLTVFLTDVRNCKKQRDGFEITGGYSHACSINDLQSKNCIGNLGSPLICQDKQVGIMLDVFSCNDTNWSLYTRVDLYQHWIESYVEDGLWYESHFNITAELGFIFFDLCGSRSYGVERRTPGSSCNVLTYNNNLIFIAILSAAKAYFIVNFYLFLKLFS
ncbi:hypothetical protein ILUMI_02341 [Ignelater luminosus]|uniref:Peptidase S1 domain-containing protein n=1 Tax=Ignelater luminosus TaxID=2038154 RepID=A0A8K0DIH4_IGNLU|nr:hypothetical protein ILUMI_02341 [Ignelater luminosus]